MSLSRIWHPRMGMIVQFGIVGHLWLVVGGNSILTTCVTSKYSIRSISGTVGPMSGTFAHRWNFSKKPSQELLNHFNQ